MSLPGLYDRPVLALDPGMHTAPIKRADIDGSGRFAVTGSDDKTVRIWSVADGKLLRTIRVPAGPGNIGKLYAVAISPDGRTIAAGGWTRKTCADSQEQIYLFDTYTGTMIGRLDGLPDVVGHLAFSPDCKRLAVVFGGANGARLYKQSAHGVWVELARDTEYGDDSYGAVFSADSTRLATTSREGRLRLYNRDGHLLRTVKTQFAYPIGIDFNPIDGRLSVGFRDRPKVRIYHGETLEELASPDMTGVDNGGFYGVAWSTDGEKLYAGGSFDRDGNSPVVTWANRGTGRCQILPAGLDTLVSLKPLPNGGLFAAAGDPWLGLFGSNGTLKWSQGPRKMDPRGQMSNLSLSPDGMVVDFGFEYGGDRSARFYVDDLDLALDPATPDGATHPPRQEGLQIADWEDSTSPKLDGVPLPLEPHEISFSMAIAPDGDRFLLGTHVYLRAFDALGMELWRKDVPGVVWSVNISEDGRLAVAAYGDGTLRWHRTEDGQELLALCPFPDRKNWVAWHPEGYFAASKDAAEVLGWHVNSADKDWDAPGAFYPLSEFKDYNQPEALRFVLREEDIARALGLAKLSADRQNVQAKVRSAAPPGRRLHLLAIGISDYGEKAKHLKLEYADYDARDVAETLGYTQSTLFAQVFVSSLMNETATKELIITELSAMEAGLARGNGNDLGVILFSGHGEMVGGEFFYLLPHGARTGSSAQIESSCIPASLFHDKVAGIARHGRVLVFLDACRSGGLTAPTGRTLRAMMQAPNVTIFTSSQPGETSLEDVSWENGAFTEALLEAIRLPHGHRETIRTSDLYSYLCDRVPELTNDKQHPDAEIHGGNTDLFAVVR